MAEVGLAASIITVIQLTGTVIGYLHSVKGATKDRERIIAEATNTSGLLSGLHFRLESADEGSDWYVAICALGVEGGPLDQYKAALELLQDRLAPPSRLHNMKGALVWHFSKQEVETVLEWIERLKSLTQIALEMDHFKLSNAIREQVLRVESDTAALRTQTALVQQQTATLADDAQELKTRTSDIKTDTATIVYQAATQQAEKVLDWLSDTDYAKQQSDCISQRQDTTGEWFLNSDKFKEWKEGSKHKLYCPGHPGTGKTIMAAIAVEYLLRTTQDDNAPVTYFYCNYKRQDRQSSAQILRALLKQLVESNVNVPPAVQGLYSQHAERRTSPSQQDVTKALHSMISEYGKLFIVVDALDECASRDRSALLSAMHSLQTQGCVKLLVSSRYLPEVREEVTPELDLEIRATDSDVEVFLRGNLDGLSSCVRKSPDLQEEVVTAILGTVDGM